jgi:hypothetical protein
LAVLLLLSLSAEIAAVAQNFATMKYMSAFRMFFDPVFIISLLSASGTEIAAAKNSALI